MPLDAAGSWPDRVCALITLVIGTVLLCRRDTSWGRPICSSAVELRSALLAPHPELADAGLVRLPPPGPQAVQRV